MDINIPRYLLWSLEASGGLYFRVCTTHVPLWLCLSLSLSLKFCIPIFIETNRSRYRQKVRSLLFAVYSSSQHEYQHYHIYIYTNTKTNTKKRKARRQTAKEFTSNQFAIKSQSTQIKHCFNLLPSSLFKRLLNILENSGKFARIIILCIIYCKQWLLRLHLFY